tara:strand:+ start:1079 stop:1939 length:861 start_codon:yes stop_codon:yes gene_type:complete
MLDDIKNNENIKLIYIITTNFTFLFAEKLRDYLKFYKIRCVIYTNIFDSLIFKAQNNKNLYLLFIGTISLLNENINYLPPNKYIIFQIEQLNQNLYYYHKLNKTILHLMLTSYAIYDYSIVNLDYYPNLIRNIVKIYIPYIPICKYNFEIIENNLKENNKKNILFIGTLNNRRKNILNNLKNHIIYHKLDYKLLIFEKLFNTDLKEIFKKCKYVLNLHYYDNAILEVFRFEDVIPYNIKILSEEPGNKTEDYLINIYQKNNFVNFFPIIEENNDFNNIQYLYDLLI